MLGLGGAMLSLVYLGVVRAESNMYCHTHVSDWFLQKNVGHIIFCPLPASIQKSA